MIIPYSCKTAFSIAAPSRSLIPHLSHILVIVTDLGNLRTFCLDAYLRYRDKIWDVVFISNSLSNFNWLISLVCLFSANFPLPISFLYSHVYQFHFINPLNNHFSFPSRIDKEWHFKTRKSFKWANTTKLLSQVNLLHVISNNFWKVLSDLYIRYIWKCHLRKFYPSL